MASRRERRGIKRISCLMFTDPRSAWIWTTLTGLKVTSTVTSSSHPTAHASSHSICLQLLSTSRSLRPPAPPPLGPIGGLSLLSHPTPTGGLSLLLLWWPPGLQEVQGRWRWTFLPAEALLLGQRTAGTSLMEDEDPEEVPQREVT